MKQETIIELFVAT